jgi:MPBQ/MSBQ methyltransferase
MTRARWNNILAPILLHFVGYPVGPLAYYVVSATRM